MTNLTTNDVTTGSSYIATGAAASGSGVTGKRITLDVPAYLGTANQVAPRSFLVLGVPPATSSTHHESLLSDAGFATAAPDAFYNDAREAQGQGMGGYQVNDGAASGSTAASTASGGYNSALTGSLFGRGGWHDHTDGNRISTVRGDRVDVIGGNYRMAVLGRRLANADSAPARFASSIWESSGGIEVSTSTCQAQLTSVYYNQERGDWDLISEWTGVDFIEDFQGVRFERFTGSGKLIRTIGAPPAALLQSTAAGARDMVSATGRSTPDPSTTAATATVIPPGTDATRRMSADAPIPSVAGSLQSQGSPLLSSTGPFGEAWPLGGTGWTGMGISWGNWLDKSGGLASATQQNPVITRNVVAQHIASTTIAQRIISATVVDPSLAGTGDARSAASTGGYTDSRIVRGDASAYINPFAGGAGTVGKYVPQEPSYFTAKAKPKNPRINYTKKTRATSITSIEKYKSKYTVSGGAAIGGLPGWRASPNLWFLSSREKTRWSFKLVATAVDVEFKLNAMTKYSSRLFKAELKLAQMTELLVGLKTDIGLAQLEVKLSAGGQKKESYLKGKMHWKSFAKEDRVARSRVAIVNNNTAALDLFYGRQNST